MKSNKIIIKRTGNKNNKNKSGNIQDNATITKIENIHLGKPKNLNYSRKAFNSEASTQTSYQEALIYPELAHAAKVPGMADATICVKRHITIQVETNSIGCAAIAFQPNFLATKPINSAERVTTFTYAAPEGYDGQSQSSLPVGEYGRYLNYNISSGNGQGLIESYRVVSASMTITPQSSILNQAGTIHAAPVKVDYGPYGVVANTPAFIREAMFFTQIENSPYYKSASVSAMEGARMIWLPNELSQLNFIHPDVGDVNGKEETNTLVGIIVGANARAPFRVDIYLNFEILPTVGTILMGMETISQSNQQPQRIWRDILISNNNLLTTVGRSAEIMRYQAGAKEISSNIRNNLSTDVLKKYTGVIGGKKYYIS